MPEFDADGNVVERPVSAGTAMSQKDKNGADSMFKRLFKDYPLKDAKRMSREERARRGLPHSSLAYGEVTFDTMWDVISKLKEKGLMPEFGNFYDLGSGTGTSTFAAALSHSFHKCVGIEMLEDLVDAANDVLGIWQGRLKEKLQELFDGMRESRSPSSIRFVREDIMLTNTTGHQNWVDATFVFANCAAFSSKLMTKLTETSWHIATRRDDLGCVFVCVSQPLNPTALVGEGDAQEEVKTEDLWESVQITDYWDDKWPMSWGEATVHVYVRRGREGGQGVDGESNDQ